MRFCAEKGQEATLSASLDTDRSRVAILCTPLLSVPFLVVLPCDNPGASASSGR